MTPEIQRLAQHCRQWGGVLVEWSNEQFDAIKGDRFRPLRRGWSFAPFESADVAIHWRSKTIAIPFGFRRWPSIVHEMGHVFASKRPPQSSSEYVWIGWEIALARTIDLREWLCNDYVIDFTYGRDHYYVLSALAKVPEALEEFIAKRTKIARARGLIGSAGQPLAIR